MSDNTKFYTVSSGGYPEDSYDHSHWTDYNKANEFCEKYNELIRQSRKLNFEPSEGYKTYEDFFNDSYFEESDLGDDFLFVSEDIVEELDEFVDKVPKIAYENIIYTQDHEEMNGKLFYDGVNSEVHCVEVDDEFEIGLDVDCYYIRVFSYISQEHANELCLRTYNNLFN